MNNIDPSCSLQVLFWESTLRCNAYCEFCGSSCGHLTSEELLQSEVDATTMCHCWSDIAEAFDPTTIMINVTGGEPLVRNDLFEIMSYASDLGFSWGMVTNGSLIDLDTVEKMKESGMKTISISLDGCPDTHNSLRKIPDGFAKIKEAVRIINEGAFLDDLQITTVVNHRNINELDYLLSEIKTWGITSWRLATIDPIGRAADNHRLLLSDEDYQGYLSFFEENQFNGEITLLTSCSHYMGRYDNLYRPHHFSCNTGRTIGSILANGDIYVCPNVPRIPELIQGNIQYDSFPVVWDTKYEWFRNPHRQKSERCNCCEHYEKCKGDSLHTWDFDLSKPTVCFLDHTYGKADRSITSEDQIKKRLLQYYPHMKGVNVSYDNSAQLKVIFTPSASEELMSFFGWGERTPRNCFELLAGLVGCKLNDLIVVEHLVPGNLESRSETEAFLSNRNYQELIREVEVMNEAIGFCSEEYKLADSFSLVGIAHTHPQNLSASLSVPDIQLHGKMQKIHGQFVSLILNPHKKQIAAYSNSVFYPVDCEYLISDKAGLNRFAIARTAEAQAIPTEIKTVFEDVQSRVK